MTNTSSGPFPANPTTRVRRGDIELAVFECGNPVGTPVLLVHGWPDTHVLWSRVAELLAAEHRVIAFDNRGAGESTVPAEVAAYRIEELAADVLAVADAVAPGQRVHVLGHDWGSVIGWELAAAPRPRSRSHPSPRSPARTSTSSARICAARSPWHVCVVQWRRASPPPIRSRSRFRVCRIRCCAHSPAGGLASLPSSTVSTRRWCTPRLPCEPT
ncbi:alpha/beta fold hydrolase [Nocardia sp. NPDC050710]|uniref:alpha/beta fold hydrolase n=1 Tax=Nocardia sp. NPDC050710 TaxID=3157220 RepID=UPI0033DED7FC